MNLKENGIFYKYVKTNQFKTTLLSVTFYTPLNETAAANALAGALMSKSSAKYPNSYLFNRKLASLYGAFVSAWTDKSGDRQEVHLGITVNDDKYAIDNESTVAEAGSLLLDMLFGRLLESTDYPQTDILREKRLLKESIESKLNDKRIYARKRAEEIMCENEPFGLSNNGTVDEVDKITNNDISEAFNRLIKESFISVVVVGEKEPTCFISDFERLITSVGRNYKALPDETVKSAGELKVVTEKLPIKQGKLVLGLRANEGSVMPEAIKTFVMTDVFGGGPHSKLFCNVREKLSLCYYCSARGVRSKGLIFVESGVEIEKAEDAKTAILKELDAVKNGDFTDTELNSSKLSLADAFRSVESDQIGLARWYNARIISGNDISPNEASKYVETVTREDIIKVSKGFTLDTVFILAPDGSIKEDEE